MTPTAQLAQKMDDARRAGKEGAGTHRNAGDCGRIGAEVMRLRAELTPAAQAIITAAASQLQDRQDTAGKAST